MASVERTIEQLDTALTRLDNDVQALYEMLSQVKAVQNRQTHRLQEQEAKLDRIAGILDTLQPEPKQPEREDLREDSLLPPVRITVDLPARLHTELKKWCIDTAELTGAARVTSREVITALLDRLLSDDRLARQIREQLEGA